MAMPAGREVIAEIFTREIRQSYEENLVFISSLTPPPVTLSINRESRIESKRVYRSIFQKPGYKIPPIYFDPDVDTLYLQHLNPTLSGRTSGGSPLKDIWGRICDEYVQDFSIVKSLKVENLKFDGAHFYIFRGLPLPAQPPLVGSLLALLLALEDTEEYDVVFRYFKNLENLDATMHTLYSEQLSKSIGGVQAVTQHTKLMKKCLDGLKIWYAGTVEENPNFKVPKTILRIKMTPSKDDRESLLI